MRPILALIVTLLGTLTGTAFAQAQPAERTLEDNRYMQYKNPKSWLVEGQYFIYPDGRRVRNYDDFTGWAYESLRIVMPYVSDSGNAWTPADRVDFPLGASSFGNRSQLTAAQGTRARVPGTHAPYMIFETTGPVVFNRLQFNFVQALTCVETVFDQRAAWDLPWPDQWPADARNWLTRDPVYDVDDPERGDLVAELLTKWTGGNDPKAIPPVQLAKFLTGQVLGHIRTSTNPSEPPIGRPPRLITTSLGTTTQTTLLVRDGRASSANLSGMISGMNVQNAAVSAETGNGSFHDYTVLLTAVLRRAGIPARTVIGVDKAENGIQKKYKSWVEFAMVAPDVDRVIWVPVDVMELRSSGRNANNWQQPWKHFGTSERLRDTAPIAFHFHPPADYHSYERPALYGIRAQNALPELGIQGFTFDINSLPNRGGR